MICNVMYSFFLGGMKIPQGACRATLFGGFQDVYRLMYSTVAGSSQLLVWGC